MNSVNETAMKVMIVDDNRDFRQCTKRVLQSYGYKITLETGNPDQALRQINTDKPDLVIFEMNLPGVDGIRFMRAAKAKSSSQTAFIAVSNHSNDTMICEVMRSGADHYVRKPVDYGILNERIRKILTEVKGADMPCVMTVPKKIEDPEYQVTNALLDLGIPSHLNGYRYIRAAILISLEARDAMISVTKVIYPIVAEKYGTTAYSVERCIRNAIYFAWEKTTLKNDLAPRSSIQGRWRARPTNAELIFFVADTLRVCRGKNEDSYLERYF